MPNITNLINSQGDSITAGQKASTTNKRWPNLVLAATPFGSLVNDGVSNNQVPDMIVNAFAKTVNPKDQFALLVGYNEMRQLGTNATNVTYFQDGLYSMAAFLALPYTNKILGQSSKPVYVGTWSNSANYGGTLGKVSSTQNDTATVIAFGTVVYVCVLASKGGAGSFSITVDGVSQGTVNCFSSNTSINGIDDHAILVRVTGLTNAAHTIVLTVASSGLSTFLWSGGNQGINILNSPDVYIGGCLYMTATGYATGGSFHAGSDAAVVLYNTAVQTVITNLALDGLSVTNVNVNNYFTPIEGTTLDADHLHPNDTGHQQIANAFIAYIYTHYRRIPVT